MFLAQSDGVEKLIRRQFGGTDQAPECALSYFLVIRN